MSEEPKPVVRPDWTRRDALWLSLLPLAGLVAKEAVSPIASEPAVEVVADGAFSSAFSDAFG